MGDIPSPYGVLHLVAAAANAWNAMCAEALRAYGIDIYPGGPLSAYRTYAQQDGLYRAFLEGRGAPANPPGTSSHEDGTAVDLESRPMRRVIDQIGWRYGWSKVHAPERGHALRRVLGAEQLLDQPGLERQAVVEWELAALADAATV